MTLFLSSAKLTYKKEVESERSEGSFLGGKKKRKKSLVRLVVLIRLKQTNA